MGPGAGQSTGLEMVAQSPPPSTILASVSPVFQAFPHPRGQGDFQDLVSLRLDSSLIAAVSFLGT